MWACFSVCNWVITKTHSFNDCSKTLCSLINVSLKTKIMKFGERRVHVLQGKTNEITFERKTFYFMNMKISHFFFFSSFLFLSFLSFFFPSLFSFYRSLFSGNYCNSKDTKKKEGLQGHEALECSSGKKADGTSKPSVSLTPRKPPSHS